MMAELQDVPSGPRTKTRSKMIRVFVSSTFTDMSSERKALLEKSYPQVLAFCRSLGLVFEVVDLCWGVRGVPSKHHEDCEIFLEEIRKCRQTSAGPSFIALLGNRYGHRALPHLITEKKFESLLNKLSKNPEGIKLLTQWYLKDNNAIPPTYVLQPITAHLTHCSDLGDESSPHSNEDVLTWRLVESRLLELLRSAATDAEAAGDITAEERQNFYISVLEREFEEGLWKNYANPSALLFIRETPRQHARGFKGLVKFTDLTIDGTPDADAKRLLISLKSRLHIFQENLNLHCLELSKGGVDTKRKDHIQYLDGICEQFVQQMKAQISVAVGLSGEVRQKIWGSIEKGEQEVSDWVPEEAGWFSTFYGREGLLGKLCLSMWESTGIHHSPLVVHGTSGMGKTALLCRLAQEMRSVLETGLVVVVRLLSAHHPQTPDIDHVLHSICLQICLAYGLSPPPSLRAHGQMFMFFRKILTEVSRQGNTLLIILDALDQLSSSHSAHKLYWLPAIVPPNVHLVVSMDTNGEVFTNARLKLDSAHGFFEVEGLSRDDGSQIVESFLRVAQRTLTTEQCNSVLQSFETTGCPLHLRLILSVAKCWPSFVTQMDTHLGTSTHAVMSQLFLMLEEKHGWELVGGALGYIALAREGLLETELRDIMSLDDDVISEVYRHSPPPTRSLIRLPPLLWARLKRDLDDYLVERWTDGVVAVTFSNRCVWEAVSARYLTTERRGRSLRNLSEYFLGRWAGKLKPVALPGPTLFLSDRKVPPQPLWFSPGVANVRKLQELPYHLLNAGLWEELQQEVIGNTEWLYCKSRVCGVSCLIQDLDQCCHYLDCTETRLIRDALILMKPGLDLLDGHMDMSQFCTELLARLCSLATPFPSLIGQLCSQCEEWLLTCSEPTLIPKRSFLPQPGGALQHTLTGLDGGVLCVDVGVEAELLVVGSDSGVVAVWNLMDQQLVHSLLGHTGAVLSIKVIDSSIHCLSLATDCSLRRWSLTNGQQLLCIQEAVTIDSSPSSVHLHLSEQNQQLFVYSGIHVKVWNLDNAELLSSSRIDEDTVILGVLEESVVCLSGSGWVRMFDPVRGTQSVQAELKPLAGRQKALISVTLEKHQKVLVVSEEGFIYQISLTDVRQMLVQLRFPSLLLVTEDENTLIAGVGRTLSLFNILDDSVDLFLDLQHDDAVLSAGVSPDCRLIASGAADQLIRVWSVTSGVLLESLCSDSPVTTIGFFSDFLFSASTATPYIHLWSLKYDTRHKPVPRLPSGSAQVAIAKDADRVFFVGQQNLLEVISWNSHTGSVSERFSVSTQVSCLGLAQQKGLLLCGLSSGTVLIYPLAFSQETLCIPPPESLCRVLSLALSPQEKHLVVAYEDLVRLYEITTRDSFPTVEGPLQGFPLSLLQGPLSSMALLSDLRVLYGTSCGEVTLHNLQDGSSSVLEPHHSRVTCVTASNWGTHVLVGSEDAVQRLWSLDPLVLDHTMEYKGFCFEGVLSAAFSESDQFVFTGSQDGTIKVWDVASGNLLLVQYVYSPVVYMVTFRNGFVALSEHGAVIREVFHCPDHVSPDYNPLRNVKARYRVISRERNRNQNQRQNSVADLHGFNPAQVNLNLLNMIRSKPSSTCILL